MNTSVIALVYTIPAVLLLTMGSCGKQIVIQTAEVIAMTQY